MLFLNPSMDEGNHFPRKGREAVDLVRKEFETACEVHSRRHFRWQMLRRIGESVKSHFLRGPGIARTISVQLFLQKKEGSSCLPIWLQALLHNEAIDGIGVIVKIFSGFLCGE